MSTENSLAPVALFAAQPIFDLPRSLLQSPTAALRRNPTSIGEFAQHYTPYKVTENS